MPNLFEAENNLKNYSDQQLAKAMLNPTVGEPQYMVMSELTRRKKMRQEAEAVPQDKMSVADEMKQGIMAAAQQAGPLPTAQPQGYANGGLVRGYQVGGLTDPRAAGYTQFMSPAYPYDYRRAAGDARNRVMRGAPPSTTPALVSPDPYQPQPGPASSIDGLATDLVDNLNAGFQREYGQGLGAPGSVGRVPGAVPRAAVPPRVPPPVGIYGGGNTSTDATSTLSPNLSPDESLPYWGRYSTGDMRGGAEGAGIGSLPRAALSRPPAITLDPRDPNYNEHEARIEALRDRFNRGEPESRENIETDVDPENVPSIVPGLEGAVGSVVEAFPGYGYIKRGYDALVEGYNEGRQPVDPDALDPRGSQIVPPDQIDPVTGAVVPSPTTVVAAPASSIGGGVRSGGVSAGSGEMLPPGSTAGVDDLAAHMGDIFGFEPGSSDAMYDSLEAKVDAMRGDSAEDYDEAKWLAIAMMGATMAGTRGGFGEAFGAGVNAGIPSLLAAKKGQRETDMKFLEIDTQMAQARDAARRGDSEQAADIYGMALGQIQADKELQLGYAGVAARYASAGASTADRRSRELLGLLKSYEDDLEPMAAILAKGGVEIESDGTVTGTDEGVAAYHEFQTKMAQVEQLRRQIAELSGVTLVGTPGGGNVASDPIAERARQIRAARGG